MYIIVWAFRLNLCMHASMSIVCIDTNDKTIYKNKINIIYLLWFMPHYVPMKINMWQVAHLMNSNMLFISHLLYVYITRIWPHCWILVGNCCFLSVTILPKIKLPTLTCILIIMSELKRLIPGCHSPTNPDICEWDEPYLKDWLVVDRIVFVIMCV